MNNFDLKKEKNAFWAIVLCLFFYFILPICIGFIPGAIQFFSDHPWLSMTLTPLMVLILMVYAKDCFLRWDDFKGVNVLNIFLLFIPALIGTAIVGLIWMKFLDKLAIPYSKEVAIEEFIISKNNIELIFAGLMVGIVIPLLEEIIFRRVIYEGVRSRLPAIVSAVLVSFLFAALHGIIFQLMGLFVLGLYFQLLYLRRKKLGEAILAHMLNNSFAFVLLVLFGSLR